MHPGDANHCYRVLRRVVFGGQVQEMNAVPGRPKFPTRTDPTRLDSTGHDADVSCPSSASTGHEHRGAPKNTHDTPLRLCVVSSSTDEHGRRAPAPPRRKGHDARAARGVHGDTPHGCVGHLRPAAPRLADIAVFIEEQVSPACGRARGELSIRGVPPRWRSTTRT